MNPKAQFCPHPACHASGEVGWDNIVVHSRKQERYKCTCCRKTFTASKGTAVYGLKKPVELFTIVVTLLAHGCPLQAIVAAFGLDPRTIANWQARAGQQSRRVHEHLMGAAQLALGQVQADEIKVKTQRGTVWMALAIMVSTRLWLGGVISCRRDMMLIRHLANQIRQVALCRPLLIAVDGLSSYVKAFRLAFRSAYHTGKRGAPRKIAWPHVAIVQVVKKRQGSLLTIERRIVQGCELMIQQLITQTQEQGGINTAFIERLNATFRQRLSCLARRSRALARRPQTLESGMYLLGCVYNLCTYHKSLRLRLWVGEFGQRWVQRTPAMAAGLADHRWTVYELLHFKVPTRFQPPKRRGRPRKIHCSCGFS